MLPNIFWSRTDYISGAYATKMVAISSPVKSVLLFSQEQYHHSLMPLQFIFSVKVIMYY